MSPANRNSLTSSFPNCIPLVSSFCRTVLSRTSRTILKSSGEGRHPVWFQLLVEIPLTFSPFNICCPWFFSHMLNHPCMPGINLIYLEEWYFQYVVGFSSLIFCCRFLHFMFIRDIGSLSLIFSGFKLCWLLRNLGGFPFFNFFSLRGKNGISYSWKV